MKKIYSIITLLVLAFGLFSVKSWGQLSLTNTSNTTTINFSSTINGVINGAYTGAGFQSIPTAGQLNSNAWAVTGWSDGDLAFGTSKIATNTDYTRGSVAAAVGTGGFYSYTGTPGSAANPTFMFQPGGSDFAPGTLTLKITNNGTSPINQLAVSYNIYVRNDQARSNSFNFSYSTDNSVYTNVSGLDYTSIAAADALGWVLVNSSPSRSTTISSISIAVGSSIYIRWSSNDVGGTGSRDEFGLDDIITTATFSATVTAPTVTTTAASSITATGATLNGTVSSNGASTTVIFNYGLTTGYGSNATASQSPLSATSSNTAVSATISALTVNTLYNFRVSGTNTLGTTNGSNVTFYTLANTPTAPVVNNATTTTLDVSIGSGDGNPAATTYAIQETGSSNYVQANGSLGGTAFYQTASNWTATTVTGLMSATTYTFQVVARNGANTATAFGPTASGMTLSAATPFLAASDINDFGSQCINNTYGPNTFTITGSNLTTANVTVAALAGYTYSTDNTTYNTTLSIPQSGGSFSQVVYVKFTPTAVQSYNGNITIGGGGASSITAPVTGSGINTPPAVTTGGATAVNSVGATVSATITSTGCSAITQYGFYGSTTSGFANGTGTQFIATNLSGGNYSYNVTGLQPNTIYYYKAFATNAGGTVYGAQQSFTTTGLTAPVATAATAVASTRFNANWNAVTGATGYRLDVSTSPTFGTSMTQTGATLAADDGSTGEAGWTETSITQGTANGNDYLKLIASTSSLISPAIDFTGVANATLNFDARSFGGTNTPANTITVSISTDNGTTFTTLGTRVPPSSSLTAVAPFDLSGYTGTAIKIRLQTLAATGSVGVGVDNVIVSGDQTIVTPSFVTGYNNLDVGNVTTYTVTGLTPNTTYYYRVRATSTNSTSPNSNVITVTTAAALAGTATTTSATCSTTSDGSITVSATGGSGTYQYQLNSGTSQAANTFTGLAAGTYTVTITDANDAGATPFVINNVVVMQSDDIWTSNAAHSTDWNDASNWTCGVPVAGTNATIPTNPANGAYFPIITAPATNAVHNITIQAGASVTLTYSGSDTAVLTITGAYSNSGSLVNNGKIILNGDVAQSFPGGTVTNPYMNSVEVNNTNGVTINNSFTIRGKLFPTAGAIALGSNFITLKSDSSNAGGTPEYNSAIVGAVGAGASFTYGTGRFVTERYFHAKRAWRLITAPVTMASSSTIYNGWQLGGRTTSSAPPAAKGSGVLITGPNATAANGLDVAVNANYSLKKYSPVSGALSGVGNTKILLSPGTYSTDGTAQNIGYFIFVRGDRNPALVSQSSTLSDSTTLRDTGIIQTGTQTFTFPLASSSGAKFLLLPNPYASPIDFESVRASSSDISTDQFWAWDPEAGGPGSVGAYVIYDGINGYTTPASPGGQNGSIQSTQAVYVQTGNTSSATIIVHEGDKTNATVRGPLFRPLIFSTAQLATNLKFLNADNSTILADGVLAQYSSDFSDAVDQQDGLKFPNVTESFSLVRDGKLLTIERRNQLTQSDTLFFNLIKTTQRSYQLEFVPQDMDPGITAFLEDSYLKTSTPLDMTVTSTINFTVTADAASAAANRFMVVFRPSATLPVTFTKVKAYQQGSNINVEWTISNERNISSYEVERSTDGRTFSKSTALVATRNNGTTAAYAWPDASPVNGANYYRIKSISKTGEIQYSSIVKVTTGNGKPMIAVYPNPVTGGVINLQLMNQPAGKYNIRLLDKIGQVVMAKQANHTEGSSTETLQISKAMAHGSYQLEVTRPDNNKTVINILY